MCVEKWVTLTQSSAQTVMSEIDSCGLTWSKSERVTGLSLYFCCSSEYPPENVHSSSHQKTCG